MKYYDTNTQHRDKNQVHTVRKIAPNRLAQHRVATNLWFVRSAVSAKHNKVKCNKWSMSVLCWINQITLKLFVLIYLLNF